MDIHEAGRPGDPKPTPHELKIDLVGVWNSLPYAANLVGDEEFEAFKRRMSSEYTKTLVRRFGMLLEHARPYTTRGFRQELTKGFGLACKFGVDQENPTNTPLYHLLGFDYKDKNSIYDAEIVPELERRGFRQLLKHNLSH